MTTQTPPKSLQELMDKIPDLVTYFYNDTVAPHPKHNHRLNKVIPLEWTNWRDEQRAWRETAILFDQTHHMPELFLQGPDAYSLLERVAINSLANFTTDRGKQLVGCTPRGHVIQDCIAYRHADDSFELVSGMTLLNWVHYQAETGGYDVNVKLDPATPYNTTGRRVKFRFQLDGPTAGAIFGEIVDGEAPAIPFFRTAQVSIAGCAVTALRHGMAGNQGVELSGAYDDMDTVLAMILDVGRRHGLLRGGQLTYFSTPLESGWMSYPCPGIFTGEELRGFREWLPADGWEANQHLGGSFYTSDIEQYYVTPWNLGYGNILKFDHDFIGRAALEARQHESHRTKVTLEWHEDDVMQVFESMFGDRPRYKSFQLPEAQYGFPHFDEVHGTDGELVGLSCHAGYSANDGVMVSLAMIDQSHVELGTEVAVIWGEPGGGSRKPEVERHSQVSIRATVAPVPYSEAVRTRKRATIGSPAW
jgi:vanillate/3-O-methylgallate O-demethylase